MKTKAKTEEQEIELARQFRLRRVKTHAQALAFAAEFGVRDTDTKIINAIRREVPDGLVLA